MRVPFGAIAPRGGGPAHGDRGDAERAVVEVQDVGVEAERLEEGRVHKADSVIQADALSCQSRPGPFEIQQLLSRTDRGDSPQAR